MRVGLDASSKIGCQPLRFNGKKQDVASQCNTPCKQKNDVKNLQDKYDVACAIISAYAKGLINVNANEKANKS